MTGVYISEVCLIGLFAINTAPGPIVLMAVFLGGTVVYHVLMRRALMPLARGLLLEAEEESTREGSMLTNSDTKTDEARKVASSHSDSMREKPKGAEVKGMGPLGKFFDPRKSKSHNSVKTLVPDYPLHGYAEEDEELAYLDPNVKSRRPHLWIVRDEMGISRREIQTCSEWGVQVSDEYATFDAKGKVVWEGRDSVQNMPIWEKRIDY